MAFLVFIMALPVAASDISQLSWLSGCWSYDGQDTGSGEYWMPPAGGLMVAVTRTVRDGKAQGFEYLRIAETDEKSLSLFASPSGQEPTRFDMTILTDTEVIFENLEHDFPQRIIYRLNDDGALLGRIEGQTDGKAVAVDFPMSRSNCDDFEQ